MESRWVHPDAQQLTAYVHAYAWMPCFSMRQ